MNYAIDVTMHLTIIIVQVIRAILTNGGKGHWYYYLCYFIAPLAFIMVDTGVLIAALARMWKNYKDDPDLITNEK